MAERRMFAKTIIDSDAFLEMPQSSQLLYFHLSMRGDDDGFINKPKAIMAMVGCKDDDLKILIAKKFIIPFDTGIIVIKHWKIHNYIAKDRYNETKYKNEKSQLLLDENNAYKLVDNSMYTDCIQPVYNCETQVRLGKVRLGNKKHYLSEKKIFSDDDIEIILSKRLFNLMLKNNPNAKTPNWQTWAKNIDLAIRIDKRTANQLETIIDWCQKDSFWCSNILSTKKLRDQFDRLTLEMSKKDKQPATQRPKESQRNNFDQRQYGEEYFDNFFDNTKTSK